MTVAWANVVEKAPVGPVSVPVVITPPLVPTVRSQAWNRNSLTRVPAKSMEGGDTNSRVFASAASNRTLPRFEENGVQVVPLSREYQRGNVPCVEIAMPVTAPASLSLTLNVPGPDPGASFRMSRTRFPTGPTGVRGLSTCPTGTEPVSSTGAALASVTVIVMVSRSLKAGLPLSVTTTSKVNVLGPCASVGVQLNRPVVGLMLAPAGTRPLVPLARLKVSVWPASGSLAVAVKGKGRCSLIVWLPMAFNVGAWFGIASTVTLTTCSANKFGLPLSVTRRVTLWGPTWPTVGVQVNAPVLGSRLAPVGMVPSRL